MAIKKIKRGYGTYTRYPGETWEDYHKRMKPEKVGLAMNAILNSADRQGIGKETDACHVIEAHHELMKNDPERLTTDDMQRLLGRKCIGIKEGGYPISRMDDNILLEKHKKFMERVKKYGVTSDVDDEYWDRKKKRAKPKPKRKPVKKCRCKNESLYGKR